MISQLKRVIWPVLEKVVFVISLGSLADSLKGWKNLFDLVANYINTFVSLLYPAFQVLRLFFEQYSWLANQLFGWFPIGVREYVLLLCFVFIPTAIKVRKVGFERVAHILEKRFVLVASSILLVIGSEAMLHGRDRVVDGLTMALIFPIGMYVFDTLGKILNLLIKNPLYKLTLVEDIPFLFWFLILIMQAVVIFMLLEPGDDGKQIIKPDQDSAIMCFIAAGLLVLTYYWRRYRESLTNR